MKIGVSESNAKSVQTNLRLLSPSLIKGDKSFYEGKSLKIGGQIIRDRVKEKEGRRNRENKRYYTPETVHPLILLENVSQVGILLESLAHSFNEDSSDIALTIGVEIWLQLSDYCKERIRTVFAKDGTELSDFLVAIEFTEKRKELPEGFMTEAQMKEHVSSKRERYILAMKSGKVN